MRRCTSKWGEGGKVAHGKCGQPAERYRLTRRLGLEVEHWAPADLCPEHHDYYTTVCRWLAVPMDEVRP